MDKELEIIKALHEHLDDIRSHIDAAHVELDELEHRLNELSNPQTPDRQTPE